MQEMEARDRFTPVQAIYSIQFILSLSMIDSILLIKLYIINITVYIIAHVASSVLTLFVPQGAIQANRSTQQQHNIINDNVVK